MVIINSYILEKFISLIFKCNFFLKARKLYNKLLYENETQKSYLNIMIV